MDPLSLEQPNNGNYAWLKFKEAFVQNKNSAVFKLSELLNHPVSDSMWTTTLFAVALTTGEQAAFFSGISKLDQSFSKLLNEES
jgi:hypothetical protein